MRVLILNMVALPLSVFLCVSAYGGVADSSLTAEEQALAEKIKFNVKVLELVKAESGSPMELYWLNSLVNEEPAESGRSPIKLYSEKELKSLKALGRQVPELAASIKRQISARELDVSRQAKRAVAEEAMRQKLLVLDPYMGYIAQEFPPSFSGGVALPLTIDKATLDMYKGKPLAEKYQRVPGVRFFLPKPKIAGLKVSDLHDSNAAYLETLNSKLIPLGYTAGALKTYGRSEHFKTKSEAMSFIKSLKNPFWVTELKELKPETFELRIGESEVNLSPTDKVKRIDSSTIRVTRPQSFSVWASLPTALLTVEGSKSSSEQDSK